MVDVRVLSYANVPPNPAYPNKPLLFLLGVLGSILSGLLIVFILEKLDRSFRSASQIEDVFGYPCYALIPKMWLDYDKALADHVISKPSSALAEAVRNLRTVLNFRGKHNRKNKVITITSGLAEEGKTMLALWLARLAAKGGEKVLLIDADLRRPGIHKLVPIARLIWFPVTRWKS